MTIILTTTRHLHSFSSGYYRKYLSHAIKDWFPQICLSNSLPYTLTLNNENSLNCTFIDHILASEP